MHRLNLQHLPTLTLGFNDLASLRSIIRAYITYTRRANRQTHERDDLLRLLENVHLRLASMPGSVAEAAIPLSVMEIGAVNMALLGFIAFVRAKVSASRERDETLQDVECMRLALMEMLQLHA